MGAEARRSHPTSTYLCITARPLQQSVEIKSGRRIYHPACGIDSRIDDTRRHKDRVVLDEAQVIKNHRSAAKELRKLSAQVRLALTSTPIENVRRPLAIMDFYNPGLVGGRTAFVTN